MKTVFKIVLGIIIAVVILVICAVSCTAYTAQKAVESVDQSIKQEQQKTESKDQMLAAMLKKAPAPVVKKDEFSYTVEYTLKNDTKESFDYIQLSYDVFDKKGVKLSNDMTNITNVKPGQTFKLKLDLYEEGAATYKITGIYSEAQ